MALDLIFVAILLLMGAMGAWRGVVASLVGLVSLVAGYVAGVWAAAGLAGFAADSLVVPSLVAPAVAGTLGFAVAWLVTSALGDVAIAWDGERVASVGRGPVDRGLGALVGLARGALVVVLLAVLTSWLDAARDLGAVEGLAAVPDASGSAAVAASGELVESAVSSALADAGAAGRMAARITARPSESLASAQALLEDPRLTQMFEDRLFWTLIAEGSIDYAMNRAAIRAVVDDAEMRGRFVELGLVEPRARADRDAFRAALSDVLAQVAPKVHRLQHDPELLELAQDPQLVALVESGDMLALISHPGIRKLVDRVSAR